MKPKVKKEERRKVLGGILAACTGAVCLGKPGKTKASTDSPTGTETLYRRTAHVDKYFRTLED